MIDSTQLISKEWELSNWIVSIVSGLIVPIVGLPITFFGARFLKSVFSKESNINPGIIQPNTLDKTKEKVDVEIPLSFTSMEFAFGLITLILLISIAFILYYYNRSEWSAFCFGLAFGICGFAILFLVMFITLRKGLRLKGIEI